MQEWKPQTPSTNAVKLAAILVSYKKKIGGEMTAEGFRNAMGSGGSARSFGFIDYDYKGVSIRPEGEPETKYTWSKFIKFCRENGLIKEEPTPCNPKPAQNADAAVTTAAPAAVSPAATSTDPCSPVDSDTAAPLACAPSASATPAAGFDYGGLDQPTVDTLHLAEKMIADARRDYVAKLAQAVYIAHDALCGRGCDKLSQAHNNQYSEKTFGAWCAHVGISRKTGERLIQVAGLLNGATLEEQAVLEAASPSLLYAAAKPSAPAQLVQGVKDGDITTNKQYQELLAQLKAKDQELADVRREAELDRKEQQDANAAAHRYKAEADRRAQDQQRLEGRVKTLTEALNASKQEAHASAARVKELEARPIEVKGADPDDIARWRAEGAKPVQAQLDKVQAEADDLREKLREAEAGKDSTADELSISKQIVNTVEGILRARFGVLDAMPYEVFEAAVEPFEALRDRLSEALEVGRWPARKDNT